MLTDDDIQDYDGDNKVSIMSSPRHKKMKRSRMKNNKHDQVSLTENQIAGIVGVSLVKQR